jgi:hypothetical protein
LKHSVKPEKHSAKNLPSVTLGKNSSTNSISAITSLSTTFYRVAECHSVLGKEKSSSRYLVMETAPLSSVLGDTRQRNYLYRVSPITLGKEITSLPSVHHPTLGKGSTSGTLCQFLCRVPEAWRSAKITVVGYRWLLTALCRAPPFAECLALGKDFFLSVFLC